MATDLERLVVQLSADVRGYQREVAKMRGITNREFNAIERRAQTLDKRLNTIGKGFGRSLVGPASGLLAAFGTREIIRYADAWTTAGNKIRAAGEIAGREGRNLHGIVDIANETRTSLTATADLYAKLLRSTKDVAQSEEEVARATVIVNKAFKAGGAAVQEQTSGILQLAQALGSGVLQGDELRSLRENAPLIAQAIADEFGTTIAGLKKLGADGELVAGRVFKAILKAEAQIEKAFAVTNQTIGDSFTKIENEFIRYIGSTDSGLSATQRLAAGLNALADNFGTVADIAVNVASILGGALLGRSIARMVMSIGLGVKALKELYLAMRGVQAAGGLAGSLGRSAGPIGAVIGVGATIAFGKYLSDSAEAAARTVRVNAELERMGLIAPKAAEGVEEVATAAERFSAGEHARKLKDFADEIDRLRGGAGIFEIAVKMIWGDAEGEVNRFEAIMAKAFSQRIQGPELIDLEALEKIEEMAKGLRDGNTQAKTVIETLEKMAKTPISRPVYDLNQELQKSARHLQANELAATAAGDPAPMNRYRDAVKRAREEAVALFDELLRNIDRTTVSPEALQKLEDLRQRLSAGTIGAGEVKEALREMAAENYQFQAVADAFQPVLDVLASAISALDEFIGKAAKIPSAIGGDFTKFLPREGAQEETRRRSAEAFLNEREAIELRAQKEKEIAALTEDILEKAKEAGKAITEAEAAAKARGIIEKKETREIINRGLLNLIGRAEGTDKARGYNETLAYGKFSGGDRNLVAMTLREILELQRKMLAHPENTFNSSAAGRYQITKRTLEGLIKQLGLSLDEFFSPQLQDRLAQQLVRRRGRDVGGLRNEWEGLRNVSEADILKAYDALSTGMEPLDEAFVRQNELRSKNREIVADLIQQGKEEIARIQLETSLVGKSNAEREKEMFIFERLNQLKQQGIDITPALLKQIEDQADKMFTVVTAYDAAEEAADKFKKKQEELLAVQEEISSAFQGALKGLVHDLVAGKTATEALYNAVSKLADRFLDLALDQLFKSFLGAGQPGGGVLGLGGLFGMFGFAGGGFTGYGGKHQPKGIVHGGEYVFSKKATNRIGVGALDELHKAAKRGYEEGGYTLPRIGNGAGALKVQQPAPQVDARTTVINRFDAPSFLSEALAHPSGAKLILNVIKAQPAAFRAAIQA